jgi:hypothetical protein
MTAKWHEWRSDPLLFVEHVLFDPETRKPFRLLPAERIFLEHAFQTDQAGRLRFPVGDLVDCQRQIHRYRIGVSGGADSAGIEAATVIG